jgi:hypothetical protein
MGEFSRWLLHEDRKELFDYLFAVVLNAVFLALAGGFPRARSSGEA